ncbi:MAG: hypothetical protein HY560_12975 [Gemmatimonadetes bacterium]|nr:hypothetical protein [Gemmatimonadota bacterium]
MSDQLTGPENHLVEALAAAAPGPRRNGAYALWLFVRACGGLLPPEPLSESRHRLRLRGLERRLRRLPLPAPLRRALAGGLRGLADGSPHGAAVALQQLVAPAREAVGPGAGEAVALAARRARDAIRQTRVA